jgi:hypothetical protein
MIRKPFFNLTQAQITVKFLALPGHKHYFFPTVLSPGRDITNIRQLKKINRHSRILRHNRKLPNRRLDLV